MPVTWSDALTDKTSSEFKNAENTACDVMRKGSSDIKDCKVSKFTEDDGNRKKRSAVVIADFELHVNTFQNNSLDIINEFESNFDDAAFKAAGGGALNNLEASIVHSSSTITFASLSLSISLYLLW